MRHLSAVLLWCCVCISAQGAVWREASSEKFVVYSDGNEKALIEFTERAEKFDQVMRLMTGLKQPPAPLKLRIYLVANDSKVRALMPRPERYTAGFYLTTLESAIAVVNREKAGHQYDMDGQTVLFHEYAHHFMKQYFPSAYPAWYREGFAEYFSTVKIKEDGTVEVGRIALHRLPSLAFVRWLTPAQLMDGRLEEMDGEERAQFYAQGWLLTHYLHRNAEDRNRLVQYLQLRASGVAHDEALQKAFEMSDERLGTAVRQYYAKGKFPYIQISHSNLATPKVVIRQLSAPESAMLLLDARAQMGVPEEERSGFLAQVRREAARYPTDDGAQRVLAEAEANWGDRATAMKLYESLVAKDPSNRRALLGVGLLTLSQQQPNLEARRAACRKVRQLAARANRLMPEDPAALLLFYMSFSADEGGATDNAVQGLEVAYANLPQERMAAILLAGERLRHAQPERAIALLNPIAYEPHGGDMALRARRWIEAIQAKQPIELPQAFYGGVADED